MSIKSYLIDNFGKPLGSWVNPLRVGLFGRGGGDYHSPGAHTVVISGDNVLTISGIAPTITNSSQFRSVRLYDAQNRLFKEYFPSPSHGFMWDSTATQLTVYGGDFSGAASAEVEIAAEPRAYSSSEDAYQGYSVNPEHAWTQETTLVDATNITDATVYYYVDFDQYRYGGFQIALDCDAGTVTVTLEASFQDDGTAQASCDYQDVTNDLFGVASLVAAAGAASDTWVIDTPFPAKYLRIKSIYATTGNTGDATIYFRGTY